jgi:hypothetical protein
MKFELNVSLDPKYLLVCRTRSEIVEGQITLLLWIQHRPNAGELLVRQERGAIRVVEIGNAVGHMAGSKLGGSDHLAAFR